MTNQTSKSKKDTVILTMVTSHKGNWSYGDYSGTIEYAIDERGPTEIDWDCDCPDNYEEIEALILNA
jgi:hypothetical protein